MGLIKNLFLTSNISMCIKSFKVCDTFIYTVVFDLPESSKIYWFKDLFGQIIEVKVMENYFFLLFSVTLTSVIWPNKSLNLKKIYQAFNLKKVFLGLLNSFLLAYTGSIGCSKKARIDFLTKISQNIVFGIFWTNLDKNS